MVRKVKGGEDVTDANISNILESFATNKDAISKFFKNDNELVRLYNSIAESSGNNTVSNDEIKIKLKELIEHIDKNKNGAADKLKLCLKEALSTTDFINHLEDTILKDLNVNLKDIKKYAFENTPAETSPQGPAETSPQGPVAITATGEKGKRGGKRSQKGGWADISLANDMAFIANTGDLGITPTPESQAGASMQNSLAATAAPFSAGANMNSALRDLPPVLSGTLDLPLTLGGGKKKGKGKKAAPKAPKPTKPKKAPKKK